MCGTDFGNLFAVACIYGKIQCYLAQRHKITMHGSFHTSIPYNYSAMACTLSFRTRSNWKGSSHYQVHSLYKGHLPIADILAWSRHVQGLKLSYFWGYFWIWLLLNFDAYRLICFTHYLMSGNIIFLNWYARVPAFHFLMVYSINW